MLERNIHQELEAHLRLMPVVLITGPRQSGKTTIMESIAKKKEIPIYSFDDEFTLSNAKRDPSLWLASLPKPVMIDEVQRVPEIFLSIKQDVDQNRNAGRYLLTGSANPLFLPKVSDSLAGRIGIINMFPFSQGEIRQRKEGFIPYIFSDLLETPKIEHLSQDQFCLSILKGGFPPVQDLTDLQDVNRWCRSYLQSIMIRDVRDLANVEGLREFPRLFQLLATRSAQLLNISDISRSLGLVHTTVNRYIRLLETMYFIYLLPAWYFNLGKRLTKTPKMHLCDTAILSQLIGVDQKRLINDPHLFAQFLESFIFSELLKQKSWSPLSFEIYHFRDGDHEVDLLLEQPDGSIVGIEVKSTHKLNSDDWKGLKHLQKLAPKQFKRGIILHQGIQIERVDQHLWAMPIQTLWA